MQQSVDRELDVNVSVNQNGSGKNNDWKNDKDMQCGMMPSWEQMRELHDNTNSWCFLNFFFLPSIVGKCMWVTSVQQRAKLQSLTTPSDEAFCLLVLKNNWEVWKWECENPTVSVEYKQAHAPNVLFTSTGKGRRTEAFGGWNKEGIALYNTLVNELTSNRRRLDLEYVDCGNGYLKTKMDFVEDAFLYWAQIWDVKNLLKLNGGKKRKENNSNDGTVQAIQIFGWKDCVA